MIFLFKHSFRKLILGLCLVLVLFSLLFLYSLKNNKNIAFHQASLIKNAISVTKNLSSNLLEYADIRNREASVILFNLDQPLEPESVYKPISCRLSAKIFVQTTLCIHPVDKDIWVSQNIWTNGYWEPNILGKFLSACDICSECLVLDIGANIGQYSLFAARLGRDVVAVEPFHDNILRIHKAARAQNIQNKITLIKNGLSDNRNKKMRLSQDMYNIGGQSLSNVDNSINDKYSVETILFDDMIDYFPKKSNGQLYSKVIIKMDIEGFELRAFESSNEFFRTHEIFAIFIEWDKMIKNPLNQHRKIDKLINSLRTDSNLIPFTTSLTSLIETDWKSWPIDVIFINEKIDPTKLNF
jgi:FkbM family methyltransferase